MFDLPYRLKRLATLPIIFGGFGIKPPSVQDIDARLG